MTTPKKSPRVGIIGLGFIGLPLALSYARQGAQVIGVDVDQGLINAINKGKTPLQESFAGQTIESILQDQMAAGRFRATTSYEEAAERVDHYMVTVGLPVIAGRPSLDPLLAASRSLGQVLKEGDLVILRSTVVPKTTEERIRPVLEETSGLSAAGDFDLAYCSERIAEGRAFQEFVEMPLAVGGIRAESTERAAELLAFVTQADIHRSTILTVETAKILENLQRDINIALAQEFAQVADGLGIDTYELIRIANTHHRVNLLNPGPGVGGYCLPYALHYLLPAARACNIPMPLSELARSINDQTPRRIVDRLETLLDRAGYPLAKSKVAVLGLAMKDHSSDDRESPALKIIEELEAREATVNAYDPLVPDQYPTRVSTLEACTREAHALVIAANQSIFEAIDWNAVWSAMKPRGVVVDTRHLLAPDDIPDGMTAWFI